MQGANYATAIAEHFRDRGQHVLLLMDSLTRYAMAQREIALAIGEPPATKGYPPSCFAKLPQLVERSGNGRDGGGSITAFYTVLSEGDDQQDPIADAARGILDGHIVLSRELAEAGHYPAIDIEKSVSRVMTSVAAASTCEAARRFRQLLAKLTKARDLIQLGAYAPGHDAELDTAVRAAARAGRAAAAGHARAGDAGRQPATAGRRVSTTLTSRHDTVHDRCNPADPARPRRARAQRGAGRVQPARARRDATRSARPSSCDTYRARLRTALERASSAAGAALEIVHCYQGFIDRLEPAIAQQQHALIQRRGRAGARQRRAERARDARRLGAQADRAPRREPAPAQRAARAEAARRARGSLACGAWPVLRSGLGRSGLRA